MTIINTKLKHYQTLPCLVAICIAVLLSACGGESSRTDEASGAGDTVVSQTKSDVKHQTEQPTTVKKSKTSDDFEDDEFNHVPLGSKSPMVVHAQKGSRLKATASEDTTTKNKK